MKLKKTALLFALAARSVLGQDKQEPAQNIAACKVAFQAYDAERAGADNAGNASLQPPPVAIDITQLFAEPKYDTALSLRDLQNPGNNIPGRKLPQKLIGLTVVKPVVQMQVASEIIETDEGLSCSRVMNAKVQTGYTDMKVYIAREFPPNSCAYDEIKRHEQKHVDDYISVAARTMPSLQESLATYLNENRVYADKSDYDRRLEAWQKEAYGKLDEAGNKSRIALDTPEEYNRLSQACNGAVMARLLA